MPQATPQVEVPIQCQAGVGVAAAPVCRTLAGAAVGVAAGTARHAAFTDAGLRTSVKCRAASGAGGTQQALRLLHAFERDRDIKIAGQCAFHPLRQQRVVKTLPPAQVGFGGTGGGRGCRDEGVAVAQAHIGALVSGADGSAAGQRGSE